MVRTSQSTNPPCCIHSADPPRLTASKHRPHPPPLSPPFLPRLTRTGKIRDSNRPSLLALYGGDGFRTLDLGIAKDADGEAALRAKVQAALQK